MEYFHLTTPQQNIWNLQTYYSDTAIANLCGITFYREKRESRLLQQSILEFIQNQSGIRLRFCNEREPRQYVSDEIDENIPIISFFSMEELDQYVEKFASVPLELTGRFMYRFAVFHVADRSGILVLLSHLISDAWTFGLMAKQLDEAYHKLAGKENAEGISLVKADYVDYIRSEEAYFTSGRYMKDKEYWEEKYAHQPEASLIKLNSALQTSVVAKRISKVLPLVLEQKMDAFCREKSVTPAVLFETALIVYLQRINPGNTSITIGVPILNRSNAKEKEIAGMFISTMPLTVELAENMTILELAKLITKEHMNIFRHQKYPYAEILEFLREKHKLSGSLFSAMVSYQNAKTDAQTDTKWYSNGYSEVPFVLHIDNRDGNNSHSLNVDFQTEVFREEEVDYVIKRLEYILEQITENGGELIRNIGIIPEQEWKKVVYEFNDTYVDYPRNKCVHELFSEQAEKTPDNIALVFEDKKFTYRQLDEMSNSLAHFLREKGVKPNDVVPVIAKRSWHVIVAMLGILKAGGAYILIDDQYPLERILYLIRECKAYIALIYTDMPLDIDYLDLNKCDYKNNIEIIDSVNNSHDILCAIHTSGSTGVPKLTTLTHRNIMHYISYAADLFEEVGQVIATTTVSFDAFIQETLVALCRNIPIILANDNQIFNQIEFENVVNTYENSFLFQTPTKLLSYIRNTKSEEFISKIKKFIIGGEKFPQELYEKIRLNNSDCNVFNIYGPTESTICVSTQKITSQGDITIGKPIANTQIYILDIDGNPLPIGIAGELCIAGEGVGKGYLNRPELTAERFVPNPFATEENHHGKVLYHTGDLACWREDGEIEYLGRMDTQVKIRGLRIELGEIESVMGTMEGIGLVAVADKRDEDNRQYLVGYYTAREEIEEKKLREHLSAKLPGYMIPNYFMRLDHMPMTPSGKIDRKNLPIPDYTVGKKDYIAPVTDTEKKLADIWQRILNVKVIGKNDDFYELGGDSLLAISMLNEIGEVFATDISIKDILEHSVLEQLAKCIDQSSGDGSIKVFHDKKYVLLSQQKAIYAVYSKNPDTLAYNMPARIYLPENIDRNRLKQSIQQVMECHKILKSHIRTEDDDICGIYDENIHISFEEYRNGSEDAFIRPFRLEKEPLIRVGFTEDSLLFDMHHIIADGASLNIILQDIIAAYEGKGIRKSGVEYSDYSRYFYKLDTSEHKKYFREMLKCDFEPVRLPETKNAGQGGRSKLYHIPEEIFRKTKEYAGRNGLTDTMAFLGAYGILLSKYTAEKDILTSVILQNRIHADIRDMVGMFVNTLPIYLSVKGRTQDYMQTVKQILLNLFHYQELPFQDIANAVEMKDRTVINTSFVYQGDGEKALVLDGQRLVPQFIDTHTAKFDFSMELTPLKSGCQMRLEYNLSKYNEQLMDKLADAYLRILSLLNKERIADIAVLPEDEYHRVIEEFNDTYVDYPMDKCVHELFSEQAERTPEKVALVFENKKFTYRQLDEMSNSLAHFLREKGVKPNEVVPIIVKRSWHVIVAMLGVLKAGGAYILIDDQYPMERILYLIRECKAYITLIYTDLPLDIDYLDLNKFDYKNSIEIIDSVNNSHDILCAIHTSGSTGVPKLTTLTHRNIMHYISYAADLFEEVSQVIATTTFSFDAFIQETLVALCRNVPIILANNNQIFNQTEFENVVNTYENSFLFQTPTKLLSYIRNAKSEEFISNVKKFIIGGEKFPQELYEKIRLNNSDSSVFNIYGPTETTICVSTQTITPQADITIGKPIANTQIYILDTDGNPVPIGVAGELCIAGEGVGKGYLNRPELTAERFVPNPFATEENHHGKVMYHTGDLARWREDGEIEYLGRMDTQVKIRGLRIELGEIESVMGTMEGIELTAVSDKRDKNNRQYLVGYYTAKEEIDERKLREHLLKKLPRYMIPNFFVHLDAMPMTSSGKTDRKNLPMPDFSLYKVEYTLPETITEKKLAEIWKSLLHTDKIGKEDDFFELGGDSLLAISMLNEIEKEFQVQISMKEIMEQTLLEQLAQCIEQAHAASRIRANHEGKYRLLPQQKAIYAVCSKKPNTLSYNMPAKISLSSMVDRDRLKKNIHQVLEHHKLLGSFIQIEGDEIYGIYDNNMEIEFEEYANGRETDFVRPFDLSKSPLVRIGFTENAVLFDTHHIVVDGDSVNIILRGIVEMYQGKELSKSEVEYSDYAKYFYELDTSQHKKYFKEMLKCDFDPVLLPETKNAGQGGRSKLYHISEEIFQKAKEYAGKNALTDTMVFLGAYGILLSKYAAKNDILTSIILQNRIHADIRDMVGMFVNTLPLYFTVKGSMSDYMQAVKQILLDLFRYQELPFQDIANEVGMKDRSVINNSFVYQGDGEKTLTLEGQEIVPQFIDTHTAKFDFSMELTPLKSGCRMRLEYNCSRYDELLMDKLADAYLRILSQLDKEEISDISVLSENEYHRVIEEFNDTYVEYPRDKCVHELFSEQVRRTPGKVALVFEDKKFTYRQLDEMSNSLAHFLREKGVKPGDVVPIIAKRSWHVIVAILGILKAGGAYMPVSPDYPEDRISNMIQIAKSRTALLYGYEKPINIEAIGLDDFDFTYRESTIENISRPGDLAYIIFTSGSTGTPKGIMICHCNVCNYVDNNNNNNVCHNVIQNRYEGIISVTNIVFDIFVTESILPLVNGLCIYLASEDEAASQSKLSVLFENNQIDVLQTTPTKMKSYILDKENTDYLRRLKAIVLGGEVFPRELYSKLKQYTGAKIYNIYGPAETTVWSSNTEVTNDDITIGKPIANTQIYILDTDGNPLPIGVAGELCIAGEGVGKGYLNRPELTAERFVPNPFATEENHHGKVMYHTGDLARWRENGEIEYLGRIDTQVKIRGLRIELGEIESIMGTMEGIELTAVSDKRDEDNRQYLVGYYTAKEKIDEKRLREHLSKQLPRYMIPNFFVRLEAMPMTPSGKMDRKNLPTPVFTGQALEYIAPVTAKEKTLCHLLEELLHMEHVGMQDDFFDNGGDSLTAVEYTAKAHSAGIDFSLQNVFDYPTVQLLCDFLQKGGSSKVNYRAFDFDKYQKLFERNRIEESFIHEKKTLGNILLTGATGFLGAHVLDYLMREEAGKIYCLVRSKEKGGSYERVCRILQHYFGNQYDTEFGRRIILIEGDIERENLSENMPEDVQTVIHTAASVSHYGSYEYFHRVNVEGTRHIVNYAKLTRAELIHISTLSVSGNSMADDFTAYRSEEEKFFDETSLYIDQPLDNVYIHSKFEAETVVYDAMLEGLDAKVIRVGNLTNRATDYKFQPNYMKNAFLTRVKAVLEFGLFPDYLMPLYSEFSPVDLTAEGVVKIAQYADRQCIFHLNSNRPIYYDRLLEVVHELGISMKVVDGAEFSRALEQTMQNAGTEYIFEALQNDMDEQGRLVYDSNIRIVNDFTVWFLKKAGFEWNETDMEYMRGYINYFRELGYLKV